MAVQRVPVEGDLRVERDKRALGRDDQRIDLHERCVLADEGAVEPLQKGADGTHQVGVDPRLEGEAAAVEGLKADQRIDVQRGDRLRRLRGDLLDVHPAAGREHRKHRLRTTIEDERRVVLGLDL
jgi:hypothetical protein